MFLTILITASMNITVPYELLSNEIDAKDAKLLGIAEKKLLVLCKLVLNTEKNQNVWYLVQNIHYTNFILNYSRYRY